MIPFATLCRWGFDSQSLVYVRWIPRSEFTRVRGGCIMITYWSHAWLTTNQFKRDLGPRPMVGDNCKLWSVIDTKSLRWLQLKVRLFGIFLFYSSFVKERMQWAYCDTVQNCRLGDGPVQLYCVVTTSGCKMDSGMLFTVLLPQILLIRTSSLISWWHRYETLLKPRKFIHNLATPMQLSEL